MREVVELKAVSGCVADFGRIVACALTDVPAETAANSGDCEHEIRPIVNIGSAGNQVLL